MIEAIGKNEEGVDLWIGNMDGTAKEYEVLKVPLTSQNPIASDIKINSPKY